VRALLDVNVLVALLDAEHLHHRTATGWLAANVRNGWASCPLTQIGCIRIFSLSGYRNAPAPAAVADRLGQATASSHHEFWPDSGSVLERGRLEWDHVLSSRQIADAYLLALAVARGGRLVTLDPGIGIKAVSGAGPKSLVALGRASGPP
jgi:toxin-antitoxin system PIN domain toxin